MHFSLKITATLAALAALGLTAARPATAQSAHLILHSQPGDFVGGGQDTDITYTPANTNNEFTASANPYGRDLPDGPNHTRFYFAQFDQDPDNLALLDFSSEQLGVPLTPGTYTDAQRAAFAEPGHPGLDVSFDHRGSNILTGSFTITDFTYRTLAPNVFVIDTFDVSFEQHSEGFAPALFGTFSYRSAEALAAVPEASTTASFGLLLALGLGGVVVAATRKKASSIV